MRPSEGTRPRDIAPRGRSHRAEAVIGVMTVGVMTAAVGVTSAYADDQKFPSWQDVQAAGANEAAARREVASITKLLIGLQDAADNAGRQSQIAAEHAHRADEAETAARRRLSALQSEASIAKKSATTSRMRAGLLAAHLARSAGGDLTATLALNGASADGLLYQLATMSQLSVESQSIYRSAVADQNSATALAAQAAAAEVQLRTASQAAAAALASAETASAAAETAVAHQQANADRLTAQLAELQHTSVAVAAGYIQGVQQRHEDAIAAAAAAAAPAPKASGSTAPVAADSEAPTAEPSADSAAPSASASTSSAPAPSATPAPSRTATPAPAPSVPVPAPNTAQAAAVVAYARDQIGDRYAYGGAGPNSWDCSGLTMQSYASVGISIGGHSATAQYNTAKARGLLVPFAQVAVGDLIFYTDGDGDMYHVAIYSGGGKMIEAPYAGVPVREVAVRSYQLVGQVARFTG